MTEITLKKGSGKPADTALVEAEFALDVVTGKIYSKLSDGKVRALNDAEFIGIDANADNYQYWQYKINGFNTTSVMSTSVLDFQSGDGIQIDKEGYGIKISATGTGGGGSLWEQNGDDIYYSDGNVGIGVDNPSGINLYVKRESSGWAGSVARTNMVLENSTSTALQFLSENTGSNIIRFGDSDATGSGYIQYRHSNDAMEFATQGTERMRIDADGNVGIGTDNPATRTHISGADATAFSGNNSDLTLKGVKVLIGNIDKTANTFAGFALSTRDVNSWHVDSVANSTANYDADLVFSNRTNSSTATERMRIDADGNVGIGAESPSQLLHLSSTGAIKQRYTRNANSTDISLASNGMFNADNLAATGFGWYNNGTEAMRIDANGNVGIGSQPQYPLDVSTSNLNAPIARFGYSNRSWAGGELRMGQLSAGPYPFYLQGYEPTGNTPVRDILLNPYGGLVGIGGEPGARNAGEYLEQAKTQIASWKAEVKKRTAEQPEASTQEITLEVTDGDFGVFPTAEALAEKLAERAIGGGTATLQVSGDGYFSAGVIANTGYFYRASRLDNSNRAIVYAVSHAGASNDAKTFRAQDSDDNESFYVTVGGDGYFSGTIYGRVADVPDHVKAITPTQIANWDAGTGGGGGGANIDGRISDTQIIHWDQAYNWGNHATAGYQPAGSYADASHTHSQYVPTSGNTTISGTLTATDFIAQSDERLKKNVETADPSVVSQLRGVTFDWVDSGKASSGVIAQEVEKVLPHLVHDDGDSKAVNYNGLVAYLIEEVKSLRAELEAMK